MSIRPLPFLLEREWHPPKSLAAPFWDFATLLFSNHLSSPQSNDSVIYFETFDDDVDIVFQNVSECNADEAGDTVWDVDNDDEFAVTALGPSEKQELYHIVAYCGKWRGASGLHLCQPRQIERAYAHKKELGLFYLFLNSSYINCVRTWTSKELVQRGKRSKSLRMDELLAYFGLELATSVHRLNRLKDYWSKSELLSNTFFKKVMGRETFLNILAALRFYASYDLEIAIIDPLWHSRPILEHFVRNCAGLAVPVGVSSLDDNTVRCKGRTSARSYMKSKPVKFGIRFYAVVGWSHVYLHSLQDNSSGNKSDKSPVQRYTTLFRNLRGPVERKIDGILIPKSAPSALWCAQMAHQTQLHGTPDCGRLIVMDNFYTRHVLARQLFRLSDRECGVLGTVRKTNIDGINRSALREAIEERKHGPRVEWRLVQVLEKNTVPNAPQCLAQKAGFVVFKDRSVASFYTNDLAGTPTLRIPKADDHAVKCVHGLAPLRRWTGEESLHRTTLQVPAIIVAYNLLMNSVDKFDQFQSTTATLRKEKGVTMSIMTFAQYAAILNAHALLDAISKPGETTTDPTQMKRRIIHQIVMDHVEYKQVRASLVRTSPNHEQLVAGIATTEPTDSTHMLLETEGRKSVHCLVCGLLSEKQRGGYTMFSCAQCGRGFQVKCFTFFHHPEGFRPIRPLLHNAIMRARAKLSSKAHPNRRNRATAKLSTARVPCKI